MSSWSGEKYRKINPARQHTAELTGQGAATCQSSTDTRKSPSTNTQRATYLQDQGCQLEDRLTFNFDLPLCRKRAEGECREPSCPHRAQRSTASCLAASTAGWEPDSVPALHPPLPPGKRFSSFREHSVCVHRHTQSVSTSPRLLSHPLFS